MFPNGEWHGRAERAAIVMQAGAFDLEVLAVQPKTCCGIEMKFANAEGNAFIIDVFSVRRELSLPPDKVLHYRYPRVADS